MLWTILGIFGGLSFVSTVLVLAALMLSSKITHEEEESGLPYRRFEHSETQTSSHRVDTTPRREAAF